MAAKHRYANEEVLTKIQKISSDFSGDDVND